MARARNLDNLEMGFISPTGEWIPVPFCEHSAKAYEILKSFGHEHDFYYATDHLIDDFGYILIDGCHDVDIQMPKIVTGAQKITLEQWLYRNRKFIKWLSNDSVDNLLKYVDWLREAVDMESFE